jgi:hypothetical protein
VALFPELAKHQNAQERLDDMDGRSVEMVRRWRDYEAATWRRARQRLRELPRAIATEVRRKWQTRYCPGSACYLADMVHCARDGANAKLTDDEERANDARIGTRG